MEERKVERRSAGNRAAVILLAILLLGSLVGNFYLYKARDTQQITLEEKQVVIDSLVDARVSAETELNTTLMELESYRGKNAALDSMLNDYKRQLLQKEKELKSANSKSKSYQNQLADLKRQLKEIETIRDNFQTRIDELTAENEQLRNTLTLVTNRGDSLQKTIEDASGLKVEYVTVKTFKLRSSGKHIETGLARRTEKVEACFSIMDNKLAQTGERTVHLRIMQPDGGVLGEKGKFTVADKGIESGYTAMETFNYDRGKKDFCMDFTDEKYDFKKGTYIIEIFIDGILYTTGYYELK